MLPVSPATAIVPSLLAQPHLNVRQDAASRMKMFGVGRVVLGRREDADEALLTGAISVHDPRPEALTGAKAKRRRSRGADMGQRPER